MNTSVLSAGTDVSSIGSTNVPFSGLGGGKVITPSTNPATEEGRYGIGLALKLLPSRGFEVVSVCAGSSSERAGIEAGDVLLSSDHKTVSQGFRPLDILGPKNSNAQLFFEKKGAIEVSRGGPPLDLRGVRLDGLLGLSVSLVQGKVLVAHVAGNSPAFKEGLQMGDHILTMNGQTCDPARLTARGAVGSKVSLSVQRHGHTQPKVLTLTRVAVGSGWKSKTTKEEDTAISNDDRSKSKQQKRWNTFVTRSPSNERSSSVSANSTRVNTQRTEHLQPQVEELLNEVASLKARLQTYEQLEEKVNKLIAKIESPDSFSPSAEVEKELKSLKTKVENNASGVDECSTAIKMMNLGIHAAVNGISHELDLLYDHNKLKRPPRGGGGDPNAAPPPPKPAAAPAGPPVTMGKGRKYGASPLSPLTEGSTLSPQSMRVHSVNPGAPGGLAVMGNIPKRVNPPPPGARSHEA